MIGLVPAPIPSSLNLGLQMTAMAILFVGYRWAREGKIKTHRNFMSIALILLLIGFFTWMLPFFIQVSGIIAKNPLNFGNLLTVIHVIIGSVALTLATFIVVRMVFFSPADVGVLRRTMQITLVLWTVAAVLGVGVYGFFYVFT